MIKIKEKTATILIVVSVHFLVALFLIYMKEVFDFMRPNARLIFWSLVTIIITFSWYKLIKES